MPGGRLTHEDRGRIAAWLADGLGYAEIGRRLGRPTSTISREVARSGMPVGYRADHAQQAAAHRAGRRKPARPAPPATEVVRDFVDRFATLLAATGLPRMTARVLVCLLTADAGGLTAADLVHRLRVSPASVSKSIGYLAAMSLVTRHPDAGRRRERYLIDDDVWLRAWQADTGAHGKVATAASEGVEVFGADTTAGVRLGRMGQFFGRLSEQMGGSALADAAVPDALTVVAALVHAGRPLTPDKLATALGWPGERVTTALDSLHRRPALADPLALRLSAAEAYEIVAGPDHLTPAQRQALT